jgi:hypothetical protein
MGIRTPNTPITGRLKTQSLLLRLPFSYHVLVEPDGP